jgi:dihydrofolate synthase/folylpolyglutamate synthase
MLSPGADALGLGRISALLDRLGNPEARLPPVFHVAGTNGKGSTCAFLRASLEAQGYRVHAYTSPHLVRFNERIRVAGTLIDDDALAAVLSRVLDIADGIGASFFEVSTAAAFLMFAEVPADACVIEVGLGGRLDATNVVVDPAVCGIAQLGVDHEAFLGADPAGIAREKAGIAKPGRPLVTLDYPAAITAAVADVARAVDAPVRAAGRDWRFSVGDDVVVEDARGTMRLPRPALHGDHQGGNLALAAAMLRAQERVPVSDAAIVQAARATRWPARLQHLAPGPLVDLLGGETRVWLDGGHNPAAAGAVANTLADLLGGARANIVIGMLANKDAAGFLAPFAPLAASLTAVPIPGHEHHAPDALADLARALDIPASTAPDLGSAFAALAGKGPVAILGSLYLAGRALDQNDEWPD